ncbi:uncharacterized protein LOC141640695 [Silene latifolia]|uniref:uncharacterized protein LOC141640695 n=1 Tax=Silene latifolia TaxID=37657 RepID=UPI003D76E3FA
MARERMENEDLEHVQLRLRAARSKDDKQFNLPTVNEFAALIIGNGETEKGARDIVIQERARGLQQISELHPKFMAMQYPLMFPYDEDNYRLGIKHLDAATTSRKKRKTVTMQEYYSYRFQERWKNGKLIDGICVLCGRLRQQFMCDVFTCVEETRLDYVRHNQKTIRKYSLRGLTNVVAAGPPDLFITFTCNPKWEEISEFLKAIPGQLPEDRHDILARVFKIKLDELIVDLTKRAFFGETLEVIYTVEFQKRGLPHAHICLFLRPESKQTDPSEIDKIIGVELPDKAQDPTGYEASCNSCYMALVERQRPAHPVWLMASAPSTIQEIFALTHRRQTVTPYVSASEACWRVFAFEIQYKQPPVQRLPYHLEFEQDVLFEDSEAADDILERVGDAKTTLTEWMVTNQKHEDARSLTYAEFPTEWVWDNNGKVWTRRKKGFKIERIYFANPNSGESYYLRLLLNIVKGAKCFADIRTVDKIVHPTYKSACNALGLLDGDEEWHVALTETASWATAQQLRQMFATLLLFCEVADPKQLWLDHWKELLILVSAMARYSVGDVVEVMFFELGFIGSYFLATIVYLLGDAEVYVQFLTFVCLVLAF